MVMDDSTDENRRLSTLTEEGVEVELDLHKDSNNKQHEASEQPSQPPGYRTPPPYQKIITAEGSPGQQRRTFSPPVRDTDKGSTAAKTEERTSPNKDQGEHDADQAKVSPEPEAAAHTADQTNLKQRRAENLLRKKLRQGKSRMPEVSEQEGDELNGVAGNSGKPDKSSSGTAAAEATPNKDALTLTSIQQDFLQRLGLSKTQSPTAEEHADKEIEEKFRSLSLAFKTDKQTLQKRISLQERSRDVAEKNLQQELEGLKKAIKSLGPFCTESESCEVFLKVQHHVDILDQALIRMCSQAESLGSVLQEERMGATMEAMVLYVESLKRIYEREHSELEEAKRLLHESKLLGSADDSLLTKRSLGYTSASQNAKNGRRRASVAVTRASPGMAGGFNLLKQEPLLMDPRIRFQQLASETRKKSGVVKELHRQSSLTRQLNLSTSTTHDLSSSRDGDRSTFDLNSSCEDSVTDGDAGKSTDVSRTEHHQDSHVAYHKGYEEGIRVRVGSDLEHLREQQYMLNSSIDEILAQAQQTNQEECERALVHLPPGFSPSWTCLRYFLGGIVFTMAICSFLFTLVPTTFASERNSYSRTFTSVQDLLNSVLTIKRYGPPPT